ncbi:uncharacterized protein BN710_01421 [Ruminococcus sp. CAG:563]|nr:uncharacterized protein BN710_01421 [Ruminococcus sp. CAG:563]
MKQLKRLLAVALVIVLSVSLSGCSFRFSSFDNLLRPPRLSGKYQGLQDSFEKLVDKDYSLSTPENGLYRSAFIVNDFDMDKDEEAIVFYTEKKKPDLVKMYYFEYKEDNWVPVNSYDGLGSSVDEVKFADLNRDGTSEIVIGWNLFSSKTNKAFAVYDISAGDLKLISSFPYSYLDIIDVNGDGIDDIFAMSVDSTVSDHYTSAATAYTFDSKSASLQMLSSIKTDGNISSYSNIKVEKVDDLRLIYVEAFKGDNDMITEVIYWDDDKNTLVAPLFDDATQTTSQTLRHNKLFAQDFDSDGFIEIPVSVDMPGSSVVDNSSNGLIMNSSNEKVETPTKNLYYTKWVKFRNDKLRAVQYSVVDEDGGYILNIPSSWVGRITVLGNEGQWDFYHWDSYEEKLGNLLFSIYYYDKNDEPEKTKYKNSKLLTSYGSTTYVYTITQDGTDFGVKDENLTNNFNTTILGGKK